MIETQAAVARPGVGAFTWETVQVEPPRADEVLVRIVAVGICHTDLATRDGLLHTRLPAVLGHEGAGVVESVGAEVTRVREGDAVLLTFSSCGRCRWCRSGHPAYCATFIPRNFDAARPDGSTPFRDAGGEPLGGRFFGQSSFARRTVVDERSVVPVDARDDEELALLAPLGCGIQTGVGAVLNELRPGGGAVVAVFGAGAVGLSAVLGAALTQAGEIVAIDQHAARLDLARRMGATATIDTGEQDPLARLGELTGGRGVDRAVECSGVPALLRWAVDSLSVGGEVGVVGAPPVGTDGTFDVNFLLNGRRIRGITEGDSDPEAFLPALVRQHRSGRLPYDGMVRSYSADRIDAAAEDAATGQVLKPVLRFG
ncbi:NAD(P)-dependent alcohol dehydrogenase [Saccharopolyspora cebuensis]|uniref:NAD(P)-dependent alcohol dehydrogenase n=1 Tax=Saccharopolyspora cebuensis TaxID=418759 RepID=A0ABV4CK62_9PSEU